MNAPKPSSTRFGGTTLRAACASAVVSSRAAAGERDDALEHVDERAGDRQVRPARVGGDVKQHDEALAAPRRGHQRRAVGERRPGAVGQAGVRLGQHLPRHRHVVRHRHAVERAFARERRELLRLLPRERAAERASAAAQLHRNEIVVGRREPRAGEAHQHAAGVDPAREPLARLAGDVADIGEDQHRQVLREERAHGFGRRAALGEPHVGERIERARQIIGRGEQRLRGVGGRAGDHADGAAAPALVEQLHHAGGALAADFEPRDVVADLDRQVERRFGLALAALEGERRLAERQALRIERAHHADVIVARIGAQNLHGERTGRIVGGDQRMRRRDAAFDHGDGLALQHLGELADEFRALRDIDAVGEPQRLDRRRRGDEARDRRQRLVAIDRVRLGLERAQPHPCGARRLERDVAPDVGQRNDRDAAIVGLGARDQVFGGAQPRVPGGGRGPAVVDQQRERRARLRGGERRIPQRAGGREDQQRGEREAQQASATTACAPASLPSAGCRAAAFRARASGGAGAAAPAAAATTAPAG